MEVIIGLCLLAFFAGWALCWGIQALRLGSFRQQALFLLHQAERQAEAKKTHILSTCHNEMQSQAVQLQKDQAQLIQDKKEIQLERKKLKKDSEELKKRIASIEKKEKAVSETHAESLQTLETISHLTLHEATQEVWKRAEAEAQKTVEMRLASWQKIFEQECSHRASSLLFSALERKTQGFTKESFINEVSIPETIIPRLIGKDGRNIHMLEDLLGTILIVEENDKKVLISAHDPKKRALAKATIEKVIADEKITPVTIRDAYELVSSSFSKLLEDTGKEACHKMGITSPFPRDVVKTLGDLSLRTSAGQNVLSHSLEVAELMYIISKELELYSEKAKLMGLFHDIGKALTTEWGPTHATAGKAFLLAHGIEDDIANAVASHHGEELFTTEEARLIPICDRLSAQLPGVRKTQNHPFFELIHTCENVAKNTPHIISAWAHYAGDHIELLVRPDLSLTSPESLLPLLEKSIALCHLSLPVKISMTHIPLLRRGM